MRPYSQQRFHIGRPESHVVPTYCRINRLRTEMTFLVVFNDDPWMW